MGRKEGKPNARGIYKMSGGRRGEQKRAVPGIRSQPANGKQVDHPVSGGTAAGGPQKKADTEPRKDTRLGRGADH